VQLPSERALLNANEGIDDGNFARVEGIDRLYPNLIRVPEEITEFEFVAFSKNLNIETTGWESLKPYNVAIITGWKILETSITDTLSLTKVKDEISLFRLLDLGRADLVIYDRRQGLAFVEAMKLQGITALDPPLAVKSMYLYLNKKHADLVSPMTEAIKRMKEDGTYRRIVAETTSEASLPN
jgi:polar amino acid transport system substrate-binding protein